MKEIANLLKNSISIKIVFCTAMENKPGTLLLQWPLQQAGEIKVNELCT